MRVSICDVGIDVLSFSEVVDQIVSHIKLGSKPEYVVTPNAQHVVLVQQDSRFRDIYQKAFLSVPDGVPLLWAARILGSPLRGRVNGTDLFEKLCATAADQNLRVFLFGGRPGAAESAVKKLKLCHPNLAIAGIYCPRYGFEKDIAECSKISQLIKEANPHILFVGLGAPKQEYWIEENYQSLGVPVSIGIGGSFELTSGLLPRAPKWMQSIGLEWFFRLLKEPKRLWQRYLVGNCLFGWLVLQQLMGVKKINFLEK